MEKNIIFITKKNFFFSKLSLLLEKEGYFLKTLSRINERPEKSLKTPFLFFFLESKESLRELKRLNNTQLIDYVNRYHNSNEYMLKLIDYLETDSNKNKPTFAGRDIINQFKATTESLDEVRNDNSWQLVFPKLSEIIND